LGTLSATLRAVAKWSQRAAGVGVAKRRNAESPVAARPAQGPSRAALAVPRGSALGRGTPNACTAPPIRTADPSSGRLSHVPTGGFPLTRAIAVVEFVEEDGKIVLRTKKRSEAPIRKLLGRSDVRLSTAEILRLTRAG